MASTDRPAQIKESELLGIIDKNRALDATYKMLELTLKSFDFTELTSKIADIVPNVLGYELGILLLADHQKQKLTKIAMSIPIRDKKMSQKLQIPLNNLTVSLGYGENLAVQSVGDKLMHVSENLFDMLMPNLTKEKARYIQKELGLKLVISTPLISRDKVIGVLVIGTSKDIDQFTNFERDMLIKFSENAGIAMENSKLFDDLRRAKQKLNKAYENLKVLNKMKDEFLTVASHELRTPMTIIKSYLWMLENQKTGSINKSQREYLKKASEGTQRMINLINDMLDISRFEQQKVTFNIVQIDLYKAINEVVETFKVAAEEKGIYLKCEPSCKPNTLFVESDKEKLKEIFINLVGNAMKFTKKGGVTIGADVEESFIKIWIKDTGMGVEKENMGKLFHKFARIDSSFTIASKSGGTGLGLYIVKLYAEGMGGQVGAKSEGSGKGSTFWFTLPQPIIKKYDGTQKIETLQKAHIPTQKVVSIHKRNHTSDN